MTLDALIRELTELRCQLRRDVHVYLHCEGNQTLNTATTVKALEHTPLREMKDERDCWPDPRGVVIS